MENNTPKSNRIHIAILGKRNVGKSSFINSLTNQEISIVSETPGTTTDPVEKSYELQPFGPVVFIDTAGIDDVGELGEKRVKKTKEVLKRTDFAVVLTEPDKIDDFERALIKLLDEKKTPWIIVINKTDLYSEEKVCDTRENIEKEFSTKSQICSLFRQTDIEQIKNAIINQLEQLIPEPFIIADLVKSPDLVVLVVPIDKEAPKGRLILPQVQTLRELLDCDIPVVVVKDKELHYTLNNILKLKPKLVVTDSQVFMKVDADVPKDIMMTSFSVLFARQKGNLEQYAKGAFAIEDLKNGDRILIAELCSHRPISEDIGRVKIPRWLKQYTGKDIDFDIVAGRDFPGDLSKYSLIIQCGGCMANRQLVQTRILEAKKQNIPISNYGITIAYLHGILKRALEPFPALYQCLIDKNN